MPTALRDAPRDPTRDSSSTAPLPETVKVQDAKTRLSALLHRVEAGEEFTISRGETPVARLVPITVPTGQEPPGRRPMGFLPISVPDSFFDELPEEELRAWEGEA